MPKTTIIDQVKLGWHKLSGGYNKPERIFWWLELICNLRCNHCDIGKKTLLAKFRPAMTLEKKKEVINRLSAWIGGPFSLSFIAGEPFLHQDIFETVSAASAVGATTSLTTNGTLISSPVRANQIVNSGLSFIAVSLDSINPDYHDKSRGVPGTWEKATKSIEYILKTKRILKRTNPVVYVNSIVMRDNLNDLIELIKWVKQKGVDGITFQPIANVDFFAGGGGGANWFQKSPLWPDTKQALAFVDTLQTMKSDGFPMIKNSLKDFDQFRMYFQDPVSFGKAEACTGELKSLLITHDGYVKMCPSSHENFGHVLRDDLKMMWNSQQAWRARKHIYECESQCKILANNKENFYF